MTGFGSATYKDQAKTYFVEIRSINSKQFDFSIKLPFELRDMENNIRKLVVSLLERGKIDCTITIEDSNCRVNNYVINATTAKQHFKDLKNIATELAINVSDADIFSILMHIPDVVEIGKIENNEKNWELLQQTIIEACQLTNQCRKNEGEILAQDINSHINLILKYLDEITPHEEARICTIKNKLQKSFSDFSEQYTNCDPCRFEQELMFYIEKIDFTEEKVRLRKHCDYFIETMQENTSNGKKLGFICQEIGREINTLGSKSLEANIQQKVVQMKDELEKIKEQLANIL